MQVITVRIDTKVRLIRQHGFDIWATDVLVNGKVVQTVQQWSEEFAKTSAITLEQKWREKISNFNFQNKVA